MQNLISSHFFNFEYLRVLGTAGVRGADVGECLEALKEIRDNDPESWFRAWSQQAEKAEAAGEEAIQARDREAARWAFLRSSNYRRASEFLLHSNHTDPRLLETTTKAVNNFRKACKLFDSPVEFLEIPYENGAKLPAYLFLPEPSSVGLVGDKIPVVVNTGGFDSIQEELYYFTASGARTRGYATLSFEGPGQGIVVRRDGLHLRPDWEVVVSSVLDKLFNIAEAHPEWNLDLSRVAIVGASMGGYFALRGAADPRIKACVSIDGFYDLAATTRSRIPAPLMDAIEQQRLPDIITNTLLGIVTALNFRTRWEVGHAKLAVGIDSPAAMLREWPKYTLGQSGSETFLNKVKCPVLVTGSQDSFYVPLETGPRRIYEELVKLGHSKKHELWVPTSPGQGSLQAKVGSLASLHAKTFSWLDNVFGIKRDSFAI